MPFFLSLSTFLMSTAFCLYGVLNSDPFVYVSCRPLGCIWIGYKNEKSGGFLLQLHKRLIIYERKCGVQSKKRNGFGFLDPIQMHP